MTPCNYTTRIYPNGDFRWWSPLTWWKSTMEFIHEDHSPIYIRGRFNRIYIHATEQGHHLLEGLSGDDQQLLGSLDRSGH